MLVNGLNEVNGPPKWGIDSDFVRARVRAPEQLKQARVLQTDPQTFHMRGSPIPTDEAGGGFLRLRSKIDTQSNHWHKATDPAGLQPTPAATARASCGVRAPIRGRPARSATASVGATRRPPRPPTRLSASSVGRAPPETAVTETVAGRLSDLLVASLTDGEERSAARHSSVTAALPAARSISPYPYPSGTGDRRSWAILRPVQYPKSPRNPQKRPRSPVTGCRTSNQAPVPALVAASEASQLAISRRLRSKRSEVLSAERTRGRSSRRKPPLGTGDRPGDDLT